MILGEADVFHRLKRARDLNVVPKSHLAAVRRILQKARRSREIRLVCLKTQMMHQKTSLEGGQRQKNSFVAVDDSQDEKQSRIKSVAVKRDGRLLSPGKGIKITSVVAEGPEIKNRSRTHTRRPVGKRRLKTVAVAHSSLQVSHVWKDKEAGRVQVSQPKAKGRARGDKNRLPD